MYSGNLQKTGPRENTFSYFVLFWRAMLNEQTHFLLDYIDFILYPNVTYYFCNFLDKTAFRVKLLHILQAVQVKQIPY